jgi:hypothetical protein
MREKCWQVLNSLLVCKEHLDTNLVTSWKRTDFKEVIKPEIQGGSNMTRTNCDLFTHNQSRSYLNHLVHWKFVTRLEFSILKFLSSVLAVYLNSTACNLHSGVDKFKYVPDIGCSEWNILWFILCLVKHINRDSNFFCQFLKISFLSKVCGLILKTRKKNG